MPTTQLLHILSECLCHFFHTIRAVQANAHIAAFHQFGVLAFTVVVNAEVISKVRVLTG